MDYAQIIPGLFAESHPQAVSDMRSVALDWPPLEAHYPTSGIDLLRVPIKEEQTEMREKFPDCVRTLAGLISAGRVVYLRCTAGIGRSPTAAVGTFIGAWAGNSRSLWRMSNERGSARRIWRRFGWRCGIPPNCRGNG
jgi:protein-tyrosine phosphatase